MKLFCNMKKLKSMLGIQPPKTRLVRLSSGSWLDPDDISGIIPLPSSTGALGTLYRARVVVHHLHGSDITLANDNEHAIILADQIAESFGFRSSTFNALRYEND